MPIIWRVLDQMRLIYFARIITFSLGHTSYSETLLDSDFFMLMLHLTHTAYALK